MSSEMKSTFADLAEVLFDGRLKIKGPQTEVKSGSEVEVGMIGESAGDVVLQRLLSLMGKKIGEQDYEGAARVRETLRYFLCRRFESGIKEAGFTDRDLDPDEGKYHPEIRKGWRVVIVEQNKKLLSTATCSREERPFGRVLNSKGKPIISNLT